MNFLVAADIHIAVALIRGNVDHLPGDARTDLGGFQPLLIQPAPFAAKIGQLAVQRLESVVDRIVDVLADLGGLDELAARHGEHEASFVAAMLVMRAFYQRHTGVDNVIVLGIEFLQRGGDNVPKVVIHVEVLRVDMDIHFCTSMLPVSCWRRKPADALEGNCTPYLPSRQHGCEGPPETVKWPSIGTSGERVALAGRAGARMIVALAGGVGAAKFLRGLVDLVAPETLTIISNTGDDLERFGLHVSPDIDIVAYTLAGLVDEERGWGIRGDTFDTLAMLQRYGEAGWFNLGDRDLATHILRTQRLRAGESLSAVTRTLCQALDIVPLILPMCDQAVPTLVRTPAGLFHFQEYLVQRGGREEVLEVIFQGVEQTRPAPGVQEALAHAEAILVCPSNPIISIGTILAVPGLRQAVADSAAPVVAVSPIVAGKTLKGPADLMLRGLDLEVSACGVAQYYGDLLDGMIIDVQDAALRPRLADMGLRVEVTNTVMRSLEDKRALARSALSLAKTISA